MIGGLPRRAMLGGLAGLASGPAAAQLPATQLPAPQLPAGRVRAPRFIGLISGGVDGTYIRIAADIAAVLDDPPRIRVVPMVGKGSVQNIDDLLHLPGVDVAIVQSDVLAFIRSRSLMPGAERAVGYLAKLYDEEVHVLAGPGIRRLEELKDQLVNVDVRGSGTALTASILFDSLKVPIRPVNDDQSTALVKLRRGEIAALLYVAGKPARLFSGIEPGSGLHFLSLPLTPALLESYVPSRLGAADYPGLIGAEEVVDTVAVGAVLATFLWPIGSDGRRRVELLMTELTEKFARFREAPRHPKWRDVSLAAEIPGWTRLRPLPRSTASGRGIVLPQ